MGELKSFYRIYADVRNSNGSIVAAKMKQNDTKTRYLDITVTDNGVPIDLTDCEVRIYGRKYDKTEFYNDGIIQDAAMGRCLFEATTQMLAYPDQNVNCEVMVFKNNVQILSTMPFDIFVVKSFMGESAIESSNEYGALVVLFQNLYESYALMTEMVKNMGNAGTIVADRQLTTFWQMLEYLAKYMDTDLRQKIDEAIANASVQGVLNLIGTTTDAGGSITTGTVMGKENAIINSVSPKIMCKGEVGTIFEIINGFADIPTVTVTITITQENSIPVDNGRYRALFVPVQLGSYTININVGGFKPTATVEVTEIGRLYTFSYSSYVELARFTSNGIFMIPEDVDSIYLSAAAGGGGGGGNSYGTRTSTGGKGGDGIVIFYKGVTVS